MSGGEEATIDSAVSLMAPNTDNGGGCKWGGCSCGASVGGAIVLDMYVYVLLFCMVVVGMMIVVMCLHHCFFNCQQNGFTRT